MVMRFTPVVIFLIFFCGCLGSCSNKPLPAAEGCRVLWQTDIANGALTLLEAATLNPQGDGIWLAGQVVREHKLYNQVVRLDTNGRIQMARAWLDTLPVVWNSMAVLANNRLLLCGEYGVRSDTQTIVVQTDTSGVLGWQSHYTHANIHHLRKLNDTMVLLLGHTADDSVAHINYWISCLDTGGRVRWEEAWGHDQWDEYLTDAVLLPSGDILLAGNKQPVGQRRKGDGFVACLSANGDLRWEKNVGGSDDDEIRSLTLLADGQLLLTGRTRSAGAGKSDVWLLCLSGQGDLLWEKTYGGKYEDWGAAVCATYSADYLLLAAKYDLNGEGFSDTWLLLLDRQGNQIWERKWDIGNYDAAAALLSSPDHRRFYLLSTGTLPATNQALSRLQRLDVGI